MKVKITTQGIPAAQAHFTERRWRLVQAMWDATQEGVEKTAEFVRAFTPIMTINRGGSDRKPGELRESVQTKITVLGNGRVLGQVYTEKDWGGYVEGGTKQHGRARHMFSRGSAAARPVVRLIFDAHVGRALDR